MGATKIWTYTLAAGSLNISSNDNVQNISIQTLTGTTTVTGGLAFQGINSQPISLAAGEGMTISGNPFGNPVDGVSITASGDCRIILTVN